MSMKSAGTREFFFEPLDHLSFVGPLRHVHEVHHDDPRDLPEPEKPWDLGGGLEVRVQNGRLLVFVTHVRACVHVDRRERLGLIDGQKPPSPKWYPSLQGLPELALHLVAHEQGHLPPIQLHPAFEMI